MARRLFTILAVMASRLPFPMNEVGLFSWLLGTVIQYIGDSGLCCGLHVLRVAISKMQDAQHGQHYLVEDTRLNHCVCVRLR